VRGDAAGARQLFDYVQMLSRRDLQSQLWVIEDTVARGEVVASLCHYDIVMRVWPRMSDVLFPILSSAIGEPQIRTALLPTLVARPRWADGFVDFVATYGADPRASARLLEELRRRGGTVSDRAHAAMIASLIDRAGADSAWAYYAGLHPRADRRRSRDPRFAAALENPSPLDWKPVNEDGMVASVEGVFAFSVPPSIGGPLLRQTQLLLPGAYVLAGHSSGMEQAADAAPYWVLTCEGGRELGRIQLSAAMQPNGEFMGRFSVPAGCPVQTLTLVAQPSSAFAGLTGQIDRVELSPGS
jgi:hypothetical protein